MLRNRTYSKRASVSDGRIQAYGASDGLYLSQDYGVTWLQIYTNDVYKVAFTKNSILIVTDNGLYQSYDNGQNWTQRLTDTSTINSLHVSSNGNNVCVVKSNGYYISTDEGETFTFTSDGDLADAFCLNNGSILTASYSNLTISIDGIAKVTNLSKKNEKKSMIATNINEQYVLVCDSNYLFLSSDGANTFSKLSGYTGYLIRQPAISSNGQYITICFGYITTSMNSISVSNDYGTTWTKNYNDANNIKGYYKGVSMSGDGKYQLAATNNPYLNQSSDYGVTWTAPSTIGYVYCVAIK